MWSSPPGADAVIYGDGLQYIAHSLNLHSISPSVVAQRLLCVLDYTICVQQDERQLAYNFDWNAYAVPGWFNGINVTKVQMWARVYVLFVNCIPKDHNATFCFYKTWRFLRKNIVFTFLFMLLRRTSICAHVHIYNHAQLFAIPLPLTVLYSIPFFPLANKNVRYLLYERNSGVWGRDEFLSPLPSFHSHSPAIQHSSACSLHVVYICINYRKYLYGTSGVSACTPKEVYILCTRFAILAGARCRRRHRSRFRHGRSSGEILCCLWLVRNR